MPGSFIPEARIRLTLVGHGFDPKDVTHAIGLAPTSTHRIGEPVFKDFPQRTYKDDLWYYWAPKKETWDVGDEFRAFVDSIRSYFPKIKAAAKQFSLEIIFGVTIYMIDGAPAMFLDNRVLKDISNLGAEIDFDLCVLAKDDEDE